MSDDRPINACCIDYISDIDELQKKLDEAEKLNRKNINEYLEAVHVLSAKQLVALEEKDKRINELENSGSYGAGYAEAEKDFRKRIAELEEELADCDKTRGNVILKYEMLKANMEGVVEELEEYIKFTESCHKLNSRD